MATHYDTLGVSPLAAPDEIRRAYVELARRLHPDRLAGGSTVDARRMQDVNEAWRVVRDPARRAAYDRSLAPVPEREVEVEDDALDVPYPSPPVEPGDIGMSLVRAAPWVAMLVVLFAIFVFTAFAGGGSDEPSGPDSLVGRCITSGPGGEPVGVSCNGPNEGRVELVVTRTSYCPDATSPLAVEGNLWLCVDESAATSGSVP